MFDLCKQDYITGINRDREAIAFLGLNLLHTSDRILMQIFTDKELEYLSDAEFLLAKRRINDKIYQSLLSLENDMKAYVLGTGFPFPKGTLLKSGKISKGENYRGLPFVVLDYPRLFSQKSVFAFRSMLWWGHNFSTTLHIGGEALDEMAPKLISNFSALKTQDFYLGINADPWQYHFDADNFKHISEVDEATFAHQMSQHGFVKLSNKIPLSEFGSYKEFALNNLKKYLSYLQT